VRKPEGSSPLHGDRSSDDGQVDLLVSRPGHLGNFSITIVDPLFIPILEPNLLPVFERRSSLGSGQLNRHFIFRHLSHGGLSQFIGLLDFQRRTYPQMMKRSLGSVFFHFY
jgi:hypothetical protein